MKLPTAAALSLVLVTACASAQRAKAPSGEEASSTTLVALDDDVWIVEEQTEPTFYVAPDFWTYRERRWYRTAHLEAAWSLAASADRPAGLPSDAEAPAFANYRGDDDRVRHVFVPYLPAEVVVAKREPAPGGDSATTRDLSGLSTSRPIWAPYPDPLPDQTRVSAESAD